MGKTPQVTRDRAESERLLLGQQLSRSPPAPLFPQRSQRIRSRPEKRSEPWRAVAASARDRFSTSQRPARSPGAVRCSPGPALQAPYSCPQLPSAILQAPGALRSWTLGAWRCAPLRALKGKRYLWK